MSNISVACAIMVYMKINTLRSFVFLNPKLVQDFLSQLDMGYYTQEHVSDASSERTIEQNDNSEFERLYGQLREKGLKKSSLDSKEEWNDIDAGDIIELDVTVSVNMLNSLLSNPMIKALMLSQQADHDAASIDALLGNEIAVTAKPANSQKYSFLMSLPTAYLRQPDELNGELTVLCKVHRKLKEGEKQAVVSMPSLVKTALTKQGSLDELKKSFTDQGLDAGELEIEAPGAILTPVAIYR